MKDFLKCLALLFGWFPALCGGIDLIAWFFTGNSFLLDWNGDRVVFGVCWCLTVGSLVLGAVFDGMPGDY